MTTLPTSQSFNQFHTTQHAIAATSVSRPSQTTGGPGHLSHSQSYQFQFHRTTSSPTAVVNTPKTNTKQTTSSSTTTSTTIHSPHPSISSNSTNSVAAAASASSSAVAPSSSANIVQPAEPPISPTADSFSDLIRKVASFRRELAHERKERKLLELNLEESQLQQQHLTALMREQDVQLMTSLELSASLEHALHMNNIDPLQTHAVSEKELQNIFQKTNKKDIETEITKLFQELSTIQQCYHVLEKQSIADKVNSESSQMKLTRELKSSRDALEKSTKEGRKYKLKCQDLMSELTEVRDEAAKKQLENETTETELRNEVASLKLQLTQKDSRVLALEQELMELKSKNEIITRRSDALQEKAETIELTLRHFTCIRIRTNGGRNVTCEIAVKKIPITGELVLSVRDHPHVMQVQSDSSSLTSPSQSNNSSASNQISEYEHEYCQDLSTVRCRAVEDELPANNSDDHNTNPLPSPPTDPDDDLLPPTLRMTDPSSSAPAISLTDPTTLLGFRPRFILCFSSDAHRCLLFETETLEFRRQICDTLHQFIRVLKDTHVDELGGFFGDTGPHG